jgi:predicted DNA-binding protein (MmcQ/YjbR family)
MFSVAATGPAPKYVCSFKCDPQTFGDLCERVGLAPAPYLARAQWIAAEDWDALMDAEYAALVATAYTIVKAKLPRSVQASLPPAAAIRPALPARKRAARKR